VLLHARDPASPPPEEPPSLSPASNDPRAAGKRAAVDAALALIKPGMRLGIGSGSTVNLLIERLAASPGLVDSAVAASSATEARLRDAGIDIDELNLTGPLELYLDGADEADPGLRLIKGGGAALTREKIIAAASRRFVCLVDDSKRVAVLGAFGLPLEVVPMARSFVAREIVRLGADPEYREGTLTDNGNVILDCYGFRIDDPPALEAAINAIPGVVTCGLFAARGADQLIVGRADGQAERVAPSS